jgi:phospholipid/cholesterol/gamma-HCH transport system substrate-binding protein
MYDRAYAVATGVFLVAAIAMLLVTAYWLTGADPDRRPYVIVSPYSVAGLPVGSEILYRGVPAGRVERIRIAPEDPAQVLVDVAIDPHVPVLRSTRFVRMRTTAGSRPRSNFLPKGCRIAWHTPTRPHRLQPSP